MLNLFLAFLQPRFDPSLADDLAADEVEEGAPGLPGSEPKGSGSGGFKGLMSGFGNGGEDEEFRPFIRRLPGMYSWPVWFECDLENETDDQNSNSGIPRPRPMSSLCCVQ